MPRVPNQPRREPGEEARQTRRDAGRVPPEFPAHAAQQQQGRRRQRRHDDHVRPHADAGQQAEREIAAPADLLPCAQAGGQARRREQRQRIHEQRHHVAAARGVLELEIGQRTEEPGQQAREPAPWPGRVARPAPQEKQRRRREQHRAQIDREARRAQQTHHQRAGHRLEAAHVGLAIEEDRKFLQRRHVARHQRHHGRIGLGDGPRRPGPRDARGDAQRQRRPRQDVSGFAASRLVGFHAHAAHLNGGTSRRSWVGWARRAGDSRSPRGHCRRASPR